MKKPQLPDTEKQSLKEFCDFVEAEPVTPSSALDSKVMLRVERDIHPPLWAVFGKFAFIETVVGISTLYFCPQFGVEFGEHNEFFHNLHERVDFFTFYVICGLLFVALGAAMSGLLLSRNELLFIKKSKYVYYLAYGVAASLAFYLLGAEILFIGAIPWILGAFIGNLLGFGLVSRVRIILLTANPDLS